MLEQLSGASIVCCQWHYQQWLVKCVTTGHGCHWHYHWVYRRDWWETVEMYFRFWKSGYWSSHLGYRKYHIRWDQFVDINVLYKFTWWQKLMFLLFTCKPQIQFEILYFEYPYDVLCVPPRLLFITLAVVGGFSQFFHCCTQLATNLLSYFPPHFKHFAALSCEI